MVDEGGGGGEGEGGGGEGGGGEGGEGEGGGGEGEGGGGEGGSGGGSAAAAGGGGGGGHVVTSQKVVATVRLRIEMAQFSVLVAPPACRKATALTVTGVEAATDVMFVEVSEVGLIQSEHFLELVL
jgi:hypothetical protein